MATPQPRLPLVGLLLIAAVPVAIAACGGDGDDDGLTTIDRHAGVAEPLTIEEIYNPSFTDEYPQVVAEVNGERISGEDLAVRVAQQIYGRWQYESGSFADQSGAPQELIDQQLEELEARDPLEELIDRELLRQAAEGRGLLPSYEEAVAFTREEEQRFLNLSPSRTIEDVFALLGGLEALGYPLDDWASDPEIVQMYQTNLGVGEVRKAVCESDVDEFGRINAASDIDCSELLRELRGQAQIVYYVRWAD